MNNITLNELENRILWYSNRYNVKFNRSEIYALYPIDEEYGWPQTWPNNVHSGVYALLDTNKNVKYIGKAHNLGARFSSYFMYGNENECQPKDVKAKDIRYIISFASQDCERYTCLSLEEYLISELNPEYNTLGRTKWD